MERGSKSYLGIARILADVGRLAHVTEQAAHAVLEEGYSKMIADLDGCAYDDTRITIRLNEFYQSVRLLGSIIEAESGHLEALYGDSEGVPLRAVGHRIACSSKSKGLSLSQQTWATICNAARSRGLRGIAECVNKRLGLAESCARQLLEWREFDREHLMGFQGRWRAEQEYASAFLVVLSGILAQETETAVSA